MKSIIKISLLMLLIFTMGCSASKNTNTTKSKSEISTELSPEQIKQEKLILDHGLVKGVVIERKDSNCAAHLIKTIPGGELLNPVEWKHTKYKVAGKIVYIKYRGSRIQQTDCLDSKPIIIEEIKVLD